MVSDISIPELVSVGKEGMRSLFVTDRNERLSVTSPNIKYSFGSSN
jgi:hypothetical protein